MISAIWQDFAFGLRLMRRRPGFSATAVLVLSLAIGVNTALFSVVNALLFTPLPVRAPERLFYVYQQSPEGRTFAPMVGDDQMQLLRSQTRAVADYTLHSAASATIAMGDDVELLVGEAVSADYFSFLGVGVALGRPLGMEDENPGAPAAMVISHALWVRKFQSDAAVAGRTVRVNDRYISIVGVAPRGFFGVRDRLTPSDFWMAGSQWRDERWRGAPIGRLKSEASFTSLETRFQALSPALAALEAERLGQAASAAGGRISPQTDARLRQARFVVRPASDVQMPFEPELRLVPRGLVAGLVAIVMLVLLIATANVIGLLLARGVTRGAEVAVRRALGAGQGRLGRQLLVESLLLSVASGFVGLALTFLLIGVFRAKAPSRFAIDVSIDLRVLTFVAAISIVTGVFAGLAPVRQAFRVNVADALGSATGSRPVRRRLRHAIVVPQVALCLALLSVAAVQTRSLLRVEMTDRGYRADGVTVFNLGRPVPREFDAATTREWLERVPKIANDIAVTLEQSPAIRAVGFTARLPLGSDDGGYRLVTETDVAAGSDPRPETPWVSVTGGYFDVMGMRVSGRTFDSRDTGSSGKVAVVSERLAASFWPGVLPVGQRLAIMQGARRGDWIEVVGVVNDVKPVLSAPRETGLLYLPLNQAPIRGLGLATLVTRGSADQRTLVETVKRAVKEAEPLLDVYRVAPLTHVVDEMLYPRRLAASVLLGAGLIGLALACIGLYGVVSYSVAQRLREIGIRATLGADRRDILLLVLREGAGVTAVAGVIGAIISVVGIRWASRAVPGVPAPDFTVIAAVAVAMSTVVIAACPVPAYRASRVDPAHVLRGL